MENRSFGHADRNELALYQQAAAVRHESTVEELGNGSLSQDELHLLIEFFRLLDRWDRQEVVQ